MTVRERSSSRWSETSFDGFENQQDQNVGDGISPEFSTKNDQEQANDEKGEDDLTRIASKNLDDNETAPQDTQKRLPEGCTYGPVMDTAFLSDTKIRLEDGNDARVAEDDMEKRVIWVDFPVGSPANPFNFAASRKFGMTIVAALFTWLTGVNLGAFTIGYASMMEDLNCTRFQASLGNGVYNFGFGIAPLLIAPLSEEFGRRWTYVIAVIAYLLMHIMLALSRNLGTMLAARVLQGCAGSVAATLVGGTIADIFVPADRGLPTAVFSFAAIAGSAFGPLLFCWVESTERLQWRWIWYIQSMMIAALIVPICLIMRETREPVILRRRAKKLRKERGLMDGGRYTARSEIGKVSFWNGIKTNCLRAITFLAVEPILLFFAIWMGLAWGVLYAMVTGLSYVFKGTYGFTTNQVGLVYLTIVIGASIGLATNFIQDAIYRRRVSIDGIEARLYSPMVGGIGLAIGCVWFGLTSLPSVHWILPCIGIVIIIASIFPIYLSGFIYISECYGSYASSAIAAQSWVRNTVAAVFIFFILSMYDALTPRWTCVTWGCVALLLSSVPFIAFKYGPQIRARSKFSKLLMKEEQERILREKEAAQNSQNGQ
ncbi:uncharacterized protein I303_101833 [Kwoniella dejecticola CBS 10117]|uniref:Major facilitator superfamily (MFS) profile domain-containing protein n=1 Tax=Kwoniella dejecticola CBS 10117 TaxID=1296121 RepID=A0A1A6ACP7_9TREE|nr:uncharacterized protein I303_02031 [Kwoniella dejecticola CBS 10117]OBR87818.1 hypothetical protein I303_02031 [Kwoniella dejecticola CBS 10117]